MGSDSVETQRLQFETEGLRRRDLDGDPFSQFRLWFQQAHDLTPGRWFEPDAMTIAASDGAGVSARTVLLKEFDSDGFAFYTNYSSQKGRQLAANPNAALLFHWPYLARQVRIEGSVKMVDRRRSETYFHSRPRGSQLSAAISGQSEVVENREFLENAAAKLEAELDGANVPLPESWGGYQVTPRRFEFWQGRSNRLHDRFVYRRAEDGWVIERLSP